MVDDAKLKLLAFEDRWHYVAILCCKTQGLLDSTKPELLDRSVAAKLGVGLREAAEIQRRLVEVDLIDAQWQPLGWDRRQFRSDNVTERVRRHRASKSGDAPPSALPPKDTDTDTDTEGKRSVKQERNVSETLQLHPTLPVEAWQEWLAYRRERRFPTSDRALKAQLKLLARFDTDTQSEIIETSINAGWRGLFAPKRMQRGRSRYEELMQDRRPAPAPSAAAQFLLGGKA